MGKVKQSDIDRLKESGKLSASAVKELKNSNSISTKRTTVKRYIKTANGTYVIPSLYFRGGKGLEPSKEMIKFQTEYDKLLTKYTTTTNK
jgi:hypothetical protein|tara:strand:+ start:192 stop:461 length:270 start_codon:yes stop_codon:yes gene_type:complete